MSVSSKKEEEFNHWYANHHIPHIIKRFPDPLVKRFVSIDEHEKHYLTIYEFLYPERLGEAREITKDQSRPEKKEWDNWQAICVEKFERFYYYQIFPESALNLLHNSRALHIVDLKLAPDLSPNEEREFNEWYHSDHIPLILRLFPDFFGAKRYVTATDTEKIYMTIYGTSAEAQMKKIKEEIHRPGREGRVAWDQWEKACVKEIRRGFYTQIYP
jgi:hypothetical protein